MAPFTDETFDASSRRRFLGLSGALTAVGLAGCVAPWTDEDGSEGRHLSFGADGEYVPHPDEDVVLFRRGLRRLGYYPEEVVPDSVSVNWQFPVNYVDHTAAKSSPILAPDGETVLFCGDTGWIHAMSPTGETRWAARTGATELGFHGTPAIAHGVAYVGGYDGDLYAYDVETGEQLWRTRASDLHGALAIGSSPAYIDGTIYVVSEYTNPREGTLWVIDPETGQPLDYDDRLWGRPHPSPTIDLEYDRLVTGSNDGAVYCWEFPSLEFDWKFQAGPDGKPDGEPQAGGEFHLGAEIKGTVAAYDGRVFFGSWDGHFYCLDIEDGTEQWALETGEVIMSNPAVDVDEGVVYMGDDGGEVYALDVDSGDALWSADVGGRVIGSLTVTAETVLVGSYDSHLYALDKETGERYWRVENRGRVTSAAIPHDGRIYYAERAVFSGYYDDDVETVMETPGHAYCLAPE